MDPRPPSSPSHRLALWALSLSLLAGCATPGAAAAPENRLHHMAGKHVYDVPLETVWPQAVKLMSDSGYASIESQDAFELVTDWKVALDSAMAQVWVRYYVSGERLEADRCIVHFDRAQISYVPTNTLSTTSYHNGSGIEIVNPLNKGTAGALKLKNKKQEDRAAAGVTQTGTRDYAMEWELLKRVQPDVAKRLEGYAERP